MGKKNLLTVFAIVTFLFQVCLFSNAAPPIIEAAKKGDLKSLEKWLRQGQDIDQDFIGSYAIHFAAQAGKLNIVKYLIETPKVDPNKRDIYNKTPLHIAAYSSQFPLVEYLVLKTKADINAKDKFGNTPLIHAVSINLPFIIKYEIVKVLLMHGARVDIKNKDGQTALDVAKEMLIHSKTKKGYEPITSALTVAIMLLEVAEKLYKTHGKHYLKRLKKDPLFDEKQKTSPFEVITLSTKLKGLLKKLENESKKIDKQYETLKQQIEDEESQISKYNDDIKKLEKKGVVDDAVYKQKAILLKIVENVLSPIYPHSMVEKEFAKSANKETINKNPKFFIYRYDKIENQLITNDDKVSRKEFAKKYKEELQGSIEKEKVKGEIAKLTDKISASEANVEAYIAQAEELENQQGDIKKDIEICPELFKLWDLVANVMDPFFKHKNVTPKFRTLDKKIIEKYSDDFVYHPDYIYEMLIVREKKDRGEFAKWYQKLLQKIIEGKIKKYSV